MSHKTQRIVWAAAIIAAVVGFYVYSHWKPGGNLFFRIRANSSEFKDINYARFMGAETLRKARSEELVAEVNEVIKQNGLPADVFFDDGKQIHNIAITLHDLFHPYYDSKNPDDALEKLWNVSPTEEWNIDEQTLASVRTTFSQMEPKRRIIRTELQQRETYFYYIFVYPESFGMWDDAGVTINTDASQYLSDYALLEEYAIAQALLDGNINEAIDALKYIFRMTYLASHLGNVGTRSDAALVRLRTFDVMQRVILDPNFSRTNMVELRKMLEEQYENWVPEHVTWFGDRASGIVLYHRLALYLPVDVLEDTEYNELKNRRLVKEIKPGEFEPGIFDKGFSKYHEADEAFYLRSMQKILDVSKKPFIKRLNVLRQIDEERLSKENTVDEQDISTEPFVANILLKDVNRLMQIFAKDESALKRALVLTQRSLGQSNTDQYRDPFTDEPYTIRKVDYLLSITSPELLRPFRVPVFTSRE